MNNSDARGAARFSVRQITRTGRSALWLSGSLALAMGCGAGTDTTEFGNPGWEEALEVEQPADTVALVEEALETQGYNLDHVEFLDGEVRIEGDIVMPFDQVLEMSSGTVEKQTFYNRGGKVASPGTVTIAARSDVSELWKDALEDAVAAWNAVPACSVNIELVSPGTADVDVQMADIPVTEGGITPVADARLPSNGKAGNRIRIDFDYKDYPDKFGTMIHEVGHTLGFRHVFSDITSLEEGVEKGNAEGDRIAGTPRFDDISFMGPSGGSSRFSRGDVVAAQLLYPLRPGLSCQGDGDRFCASVGATCDRANTSAVSDRRQLCRWPLATSINECHEETAGIWTYLNSSFSKNNPGSVPPGFEAVCTTQISNIRCSPSGANVCRAFGATCDRLGSPKKAYCRWSVLSFDECISRRGKYAVAASSLARSQPGLVPITEQSTCFAGVDGLPVESIVGVGSTSFSLFSKSSLTAPWRSVADSAGVRDVTVLPDGTILGVGSTNFGLWTKSSLTAPWKSVANSAGVRAVDVLPDGTILGVGSTNFGLWTKSSLTAPWKSVANSAGVREIAIMHDGTILGVGSTSFSLFSKSSLTAPWKSVANSAGIRSVDVLPDGTILGVGSTNFGLWTKSSLTAPWKSVANSAGVRAVSHVGNAR